MNQNPEPEPIRFDVFNGVSEGLRKLRMNFIRTPGPKLAEYRKNRAALNELIDGFLDELPQDASIDALSEAINHLAHRLNSQKLLYKPESDSFWGDAAKSICKSEG